MCQVPIPSHLSFSTFSFAPQPSIPSPPTPPPQIDDAVIEVERPASPSAAEAGDLFSLSEEDRRKLRKERFGENEPVTLDEKRSARAQRFAPYIATPVTRPSKEEVVEGEVRCCHLVLLYTSIALLFRTKNHATPIIDSILFTPSQARRSAIESQAERRKARAERFLDPNQKEEAERRKARAERFSS